MTRKHFEAIAAKIRQELELGYDPLTLRRTADDLSEVFIAANPRFNQSAFMAACGF